MSMNHRSPPLSLAVVVGLCAVTMPAPSVDANPRDAIPDQYSVVPKDSAASLDDERGRAARVADVAGEIAMRHRAALVRTCRRVLRGFVVRADDRAQARLRVDPRVDYVEEDGVSSISVTQNSARWSIDRIGQRTPSPSGACTCDTTVAGLSAWS